MLTVRNRKSNTTSSKADGGLFSLLNTGDSVQSLTTDAHFKDTAVPLRGGAVGTDILA